ncbi:MAG: hypothetical protein MHPSP_002073, partial [Paramarteilia canceri]
MSQKHLNDISIASVVMKGTKNLSLAFTEVYNTGLLEHMDMNSNLKLQSLDLSNGVYPLQFMNTIIQYSLNLENISLE